MTMLAALSRYYDRLAGKGGVPPFGYSTEKIGWCLVLGREGEVRQVIDLREDIGTKRRSRLMVVPQSFKRPGTTPRAFFLWDNTAFSLGVTGQDRKSAVSRHEAFKALHRELIEDTDDPGLNALLMFLLRWMPSQFGPPMFPEEMRDANVAFRFSEDRGYLHERSAAKAIWARRIASSDAKEGLCLVSGERSLISRVHPAIRGQFSSPAPGGAFSIVSFNCDAFTSYGHEQGANAPVGEAAAFAYTTVLNRFLTTGSRNRVQVGDASVVFWADAADAEQVEVAEAVFGAALGMEIDEEMQANKVRPILEDLARGRPLADLNPVLAKGVRFYVLGLSPNAARLSVRFWFEDNFGWFADNIGAHARDLRLDPPPSVARPGIWRLLIETASQRKSENVPPQLAGEMLRAILSGHRYPATLLATLLMRLRADGDVNALRVAMLKAVIARNHRLDASPTTEDPPVSYDPDCKEPGYLLGRLFAVYEYAQSAALGRSLNATIKDKFYGAAATTPQNVFPLLDRGSVPHLSKIRKERRGQAIAIEKDIAAIMERLAPGADPFPRALSPAQQALFALGYYHQRNRHFARKSESAATEEETL